MDIEKILQKNNLRVTKERKMIFCFIRKNHIFSSSLIQENFKNIWRASIFRTLNLFLKLWIIRKLNLWENTYEFSEEKDHHEHKKCSLCWKIFKFDIDDICLEIIKRAKCDWFSVEKHSINIIWKCNSCK